MKISLGTAFVVMLSTSILHARLRVVVDGPQEVLAGQDFTYKVNIVNPPEEEGATVLMYYVPPKQLEYVTSENANEKRFKVNYAPDLRRVYGQGDNLSDDISFDLTLRACGSSAEEEDAPSYFIFFVCKKDGEDTEFYKRLGLKIINTDGMEVL